MKKLFYPFIISFILSAFSLAQVRPQEYNLHFNPNETESLLFLYNQTTVSGADVEMVAGLGAKLDAGLKEARALTDTTKTVTMKLTVAEIQFCLGIIKNSTFEAKYAQLVLGMKRKLEALLPKVGRQAAEEKK